MASSDYGIPEIIRYFDCGGDSVGKQRVEGYGDLVFSTPIPTGCWEIDEATYLTRLAQIKGTVQQMKAAAIAADEEAAAVAAQEAAAMPMVAGPVTDDNYPGDRAPIDGSMAVDTESGRLYVRVAGQWRSSPLA